MVLRLGPASTTTEVGKRSVKHRNCDDEDDDDDDGGDDDDDYDEG